MDHFLFYLVQGLLLGLVAGIQPGPVMMLIIKESLEHGIFSALKVQSGAIVADVFRFALVWFLFEQLPQNNTLYFLVGILGVVFLLYMAYLSFTYKPQLQFKSLHISSFWQGVLGNVLNPAAYIYWLTVGGQIIVSAKVNGYGLASVGYLVGLLTSIFSIQMSIGLAAHKIKDHLNSALFTVTIRVLGIVLLVFAIYYLQQAIAFL